MPFPKLTPTARGVGLTVRGQNSPHQPTNPSRAAPYAHCAYQSTALPTGNWHRRTAGRRCAKRPSINYKRWYQPCLPTPRLAHGTVEYIATPRRLAVLVADVATQQTNLSQLLKGPAVRAAYNADGKPTPAAVGFARGKGVAVEALIQQTVDGVTLCVRRSQRTGLPAPTVLAEIALKLIGSLSFGKTMRWLPDDATAFSRPALVRFTAGRHRCAVPVCIAAGLPAQLRFAFGG